MNCGLVAGLDVRFACLEDSTIVVLDFCLDEFHVRFFQELLQFVDPVFLMIGAVGLGFVLEVEAFLFSQLGFFLKLVFLFGDSDF